MKDLDIRSHIKIFAVYHPPRRLFDVLRPPFCGGECSGFQNPVQATLPSYASATAAWHERLVNVPGTTRPRYGFTAYLTCRARTNASSVSLRQLGIIATSRHLPLLTTKRAGSTKSFSATPNWRGYPVARSKTKPEFPLRRLAATNPRTTSAGSRWSGYRSCFGIAPYWNACCQAKDPIFGSDIVVNLQIIHAQTQYPIHENQRISYHEFIRLLSWDCD